MEQNKGPAHRVRNRAMFNAIARHYDLLNHLLSAGIDRYWRRRAMAAVRAMEGGRALDLATGTADLALGLARLPGWRIVGVDPARAMLDLGRSKVALAGLPASVELLVAEAEGLPFGSATFDLVTAAFGVRNFTDLPRALREARRVLRPAGRLLILEFSEPTAPVFRSLYHWYFGVVLPRVGGWVSGQREAYAYLPRSVADFPSGPAFLDCLRSAGFLDATATRLTFGVCTLYGARR